jgi:ketosteroid isomerase-like protein
MRNALSIVFLFAIGFAASQNSKAQLAKTPVTETAPAVRGMVDVYVQSIVDADVKLGATEWSPTPDVSFIEPRGNEQGWEQISSVFYVKTMGEMFTKRLSKLVGEPHIQVYGNAAVVEFNWDFVATLRANGQTIHTTGRESQVYIDTPEKGWRLVHVHYSGPPMGGPGQGF